MKKLDNNSIVCEEIVSVKQVKRKKQSKLLPERVGSSFEVANFLSNLLGERTQENLVVLCLNTKNEIVSFSTVHVGSLNQSIAHPRDIMQRALLSNAARIVLSHNHPSGTARPSENDRLFTKRIHQCGELMGIELLDHLIVTDNSLNYYSFREEEGALWS